MAQQSSFYFTDGTTRTYPSSKHIASKQHVAVYFKSVTTFLWAVIEASLYDLVNNSIVFVDSPNTTLYSEIEIRVADSAAELTDSPSDIAIVASGIANVNTVVANIASINTVSTNISSVTTVSGSIANVNNVGGSIANVNNVVGSIPNVNIVATNILDVVAVSDTIVPNIAEILLADTNAATATTQAGIATTQAGLASTSATDAQLRAWESKADKMTADSYATEAKDVFVKIYTSDGDGTFTATNTAEYSALHWSITALANSNFAVAINAATAKTTPIDADKIGIWDSASGLLRSVAFANLKTIFAPSSSMLPSGTLIQESMYTTGAFSAFSAVIPYDNTIPQISEGTQVMSLAFTPKKSTSTLEISVGANAALNAPGYTLQAAIFRDSTANAIATGTTVSNANRGSTVPVSCSVASASTALTTFTVRVGPSDASNGSFNGSAGAQIHGGALTSWIIIREIA